MLLKSAITLTLATSLVLALPAQQVLQNPTNSNDFSPEEDVLNPASSSFESSMFGISNSDGTKTFLESLLNQDDLDKIAKIMNSKFADNKNPKDRFRGKFDAFELVANNKFEDYSLRVKENAPEILGLDTVKQYTGYLDVITKDKHFFYWFFESRNDPANDPLILWLNGGPGCSSALGLFFELGPSSLDSGAKPVYNPYSWNSNASVIFLDQPVGVGYSYTSGEDVSDTITAARDFYVFMELFFQKFPQFTKNKFHIAGESYAGHYIPAFTSEILQNADRSFDVASVLIGNGFTDPLVQYEYYQPMACGKGGYPAVLNERQCRGMEKSYPQCKILTKLCYDTLSVPACIGADVFCEAHLTKPYYDKGLNPYDIRDQCGDECYPEQDVIGDYLNQDFVKHAVGAEVDIYTQCDDTVFKNFFYKGDEAMPFQGYVTELLEANIPVLIYAGDKDFICNWLGNLAWSEQLDYSDHVQFAAAPLKDWNTLSGKHSGEVKNYGKFTFLRIFDAGHMVPFNQPEAALDMVNRWMAGDYAFGTKDL